ncbi:MAG: hypothetical protein QGF67_16250 [Lentisphaeria bacterium]|jgi:hypothetical protein|nr:hypothetical protein [Lentisphaeria bacterium]MDP7742993.1 hypothetical protein [Lentisphaeria bacterium]
MNYASASTCLCADAGTVPPGPNAGPTDRHRDHTAGALAPLAGVQLDQASDVDRSHCVW